ncbi:PREDICTED: uncharacterized protein LOC106121617 [Papilio xuthus]|uniref:Uncharacterized protein LOC106121617 n=1 Tax=Papilio xuthus TaxID=66420 RepID=A0AAJ7EDC8_PAPXU|nr:PREDICTED: uncharacterized protein LOC106121617 [Papilio xuthus]
MSEDDVFDIKFQFLELFADLDEAQLDVIENWILSRAYRKDLQFKKDLDSKEEDLIKIGKKLRKLVPFEGELASENIVPPIVGDQADCTKANTCHIDEFLYDEKAVENLIKCGKLKRHYCIDCNSRNVKELIYTSHSMSRQTLKFIFNVLLPADLEGKRLLDVGSRLGAVLYGAYHFSNASSIIGIEMNKECCEVQENIISQFSMDRNRIKVIHSDVMEKHDIVELSDIIVINVLDFFVDIEKHKEMWYFFKKHIKKGTFIITNRSMADTLGYLDIFEEFMEWLTICKPQQMENEAFFDIESNSEIFLYAVK